MDKKWLSNVTTEVPSIGVRSRDKAYVIGHVNHSVIVDMGFDNLLSGMRREEGEYRGRVSRERGEGRGERREGEDWY